MFAKTTKILVADDMLTMRGIIKKNLSVLGFSSFVEAKDGVDAWEKLEAAEGSVQLILSDWNMPNMSGLDFLKKVRTDERFKKLPFLLITAESEQSQIVEAVKAGVTHYIVKPFAADTLKDKLTVAYNKVSEGK